MLHHPVPRQHLAAVGDIVVSFASLELLMQFVAWSLIAEDQGTTRVITAELSFREVRALTASLYIARHGRDADYAALRNLLLRAGALESRRNGIVHSTWAASSQPGAVARTKVTAKQKRGAHFVAEDLTEADLQRIADDVKSLSSDLLEFHSKLLGTGKAINNPLYKFWPKA